MNAQLLQALQDGDHDTILRILAESGVSDSQLAQQLSDEDTARAISKSVQVACEYITTSIGSVNAKDPTLNTLFNTARIKVGLDELQKNPATPVFVQAMMLILYVLLSGD